MAESTTSMVTLLREAKGWSQGKLAEESHLSQAVVSRIESAGLPVGRDRAEALAKALGCPADLVEADASVPSIQVSCLHHRRRASTMTVGAMKRIEAITHLTRISLEGLLDGIEAQARLPLNRQVGRDPIAAARQLRREWGLPRGPIADVVKVVEASGILIVIRDLGSSGQDAVSTWPGDATRPPVMVVNTGLPTDRLRFTICHELAHLLLHDAPGDDQEREANDFASEVLAPADEIGPELEGLRTADFRRLIDLKAKWGMSIAALIRRAHQLNAVTDRQYREFHMRLGQLGWRTSEPGNLRPESPRSVDLIIGLHRDVHRFDTPRLAAMAGMTETAFRTHYLHDSPVLPPKTPLKLGLEND
jgi:Zn-dependent peptidase ImmA (M78 family)